MKGVCFQRVGIVALQELPDPQIECPTDAMVRVELAGMCGSDLHPFFGRERGLDLGTVMGHEFVGTVVDIGSNVHQVAVGDRVYAPFTTNCGHCFYCIRGLTSRCSNGQPFGWRSDGVGLHGGQAEWVRVPLADATLARIPNGLSNESALLLGDNLSTAYFCAEMANLASDNLTVVIGCGTVGLLSILAARVQGAGPIVAIDRVPSRREMAAQRGAIPLAPEEAIDYVRNMTEGRGADSVMELVGLPEAQSLAYSLIRPGGVMSVIGCHSAPNFSFTPTDAYNKNLTYRTGRCPARHYMSLLSERVAREQWAIDSLITHRFRPEECVDAYDVFANQRDGCIKAVFDFQE